MIIAITGPAGAGKDIAAEYVTQRLGAQHVSGGDVLRSMLSEIGLEPKKSAIGDFGTFIRTHYGIDAILLKVLEMAKNSEHLVNSGFRSPAEGLLIHQHGGKILYIDAPVELRHERISARNRGDEDISLEALREQDKKEYDSKHPMAENLTAVKKMADDIVMNDRSLQELNKKLDTIINRYLAEVF
jgi:dephospho-CoA kinase